MLNVHLFMLQRITALIMAPLVLLHIVVMIYAVQGGLSAVEILARTQGSTIWMLFYGTFAVAASIHAAIGLRVIAHELLGVKGHWLNDLAWVVFIGLGSFGLRAVYAVTWP